MGHPQERLQNCTVPRLFVGSVTPPQSCFMFPSSVLCPASEDPRVGAEGSTYARASLLLSPELHPRGTPQSLTSAWPWPLPSCCHFFPQRPVIAGSVLGFSEPVLVAGMALLVLPHLPVLRRWQRSSEVRLSPPSRLIPLLFCPSLHCWTSCSLKHSSDTVP